MAVVAVSCFKDEKYQTLMRIAVYSQNVSTDDATKATDITTYAFFTDKNDDWLVASWEDALARCVTNVDRPAEQLTEPEIIGVYDPEAEFQLTFALWTHFTFMVVVDKTNKIYATRFYETPMNLPTMNTHLHLYAWRPSGSANGWTTVNPFPEEAREPLVPQEPEPDPEDGTETDGTETDGTETEPAA